MHRAVLPALGAPLSRTAWSGPPNKPGKVDTVIILFPQRRKLRLRKVKKIAEVTQMASRASGMPEPNLVITPLVCTAGPTHLRGGPRGTAGAQLGPASAGLGLIPSTSVFPQRAGPPSRKHPQQQKNKSRGNNLCLCPSHVFLAPGGTPQPHLHFCFHLIFSLPFNVHVTILLLPVHCLQRGKTNPANLPGLQGRLTGSLETVRPV